MLVVGHVEQMRQSKCYQNSAMTCMTCHDPHRGDKPKDPVAASRAIACPATRKSPVRWTRPSASRRTERTIARPATCRAAKPTFPTWPSLITGSDITTRKSNREASELRRSWRWRTLTTSPRGSSAKSRLGLPRRLRQARLRRTLRPRISPDRMRMLQDLYSAGMRDPESMRRLMGDTDPARERELALEILQIPGAPPTTRSTAALLLASRISRQATTPRPRSISASTTGFLRRRTAAACSRIAFCNSADQKRRFHSSSFRSRCAGTSRDAREYHRSISGFEPPEGCRTAPPPTRTAAPTRTQVKGPPFA